MNERKLNFHNKKSSITGEGRNSCAFVTQKATLLGLQFSRVIAGQIITPSPFLKAFATRKEKFPIQFLFKFYFILIKERSKFCVIRLDVLPLIFVAPLP